MQYCKFIQPEPLVGGGTLLYIPGLVSRKKQAKNYTVHHVLGFRSRRGLPVVVSAIDTPDRYWYGNEPEILVDFRGEEAEILIPKVFEAIKSYPYSEKYVMWPGPQ